MSTDYGYGLWVLAAFDSLLVIVFAVSFFHTAATGARSVASRRSSSRCSARCTATP
jgi:hypothetical protein